MTIRQSIRYAVKWFASQMEIVLRENAFKCGWQSSTDSYLLKKLEEHYNDLQNLIYQNEKEPADPEKVIRQAIDIANYAMMIADNWR